jgi:hypothetical protein
VANLAVLLASSALLLWYPKDSGFTITIGGHTQYFSGGVFLGTAVIFVFDLAVAAYLGYRFWRLT